MECSNDTRPQFGTRYLQEDSDVFQHNAWDNVDWSNEQEQQAQEVVEKQYVNRLSHDEGLKFIDNPQNNWNKFYEKHDNKFFKDRHWLFTEFPELLPRTETSEQDKVEGDADKSRLPPPPKFSLLEVGCGVGNTVFPVLKTNNRPDFFMYACDYSSTAIDIVKSDHTYDEKRCLAFIKDISDDEPYPIAKNSLDIIIMIFVLSALPKMKLKNAVKKLVDLLKPGGVILFRDYGRYDMAQLRFKSARCLDENFYSRGDGTLVYFFTQDEVRKLFTECELVEEQNLVDRRLQVNRARQLKMFRVWIQAKYRKPIH